MSINLQIIDPYVDFPHFVLFICHRPLTVSIISKTDGIKKQHKTQDPCYEIIEDDKSLHSYYNL